jgi:hypothetical protein
MAHNQPDPEDEANQLRFEFARELERLKVA